LDRNLLNRNILAFQRFPISSFPRNTSSLAVDLAQSAFNQPSRPYLCDPTEEEELIHESLDLSFQVGLAVSHIDREIIDKISRNRNRRLFPNQACCTDC
jgi:hypothetical protein